MERFPGLASLVHHKLLALYGNQSIAHDTRMFAAELVSASGICLMTFTLFSAWSGGEWSYAALGLLGAVGVPYLMLKELDLQIRNRKRKIILELPELLNMLILLVNAGETVPQAWIRCTAARGALPHSPLTMELIRAARELEMNVSFAKVLEDFAKRCGVTEVSLFASAILLNHRRGGQDFVASVKGLSIELWERRKSVSRMLGEEASSKLVFPMVLIFFIVMIIVASPALLMMT